MDLVVKLRFYLSFQKVRVEGKCQRKQLLQVFVGLNYYLKNCLNDEDPKVIAKQ